MKKILLSGRILGLLMFFCLSTVSSFSQESASASYMEKYNEKMNRTKWFRNARFGMFIHYGPYAIPACGEWVKSNKKMTTEDYQKYVDAFAPNNYKPAEWAAIAKQAGMKYAVMTAKHHDGFCMFDSDYTDYKITANMPGRDFIKEYVDAFRKEGLKVGLYYSLIDWHHKDYPNVGNHPMRENKEYSKKKYNWKKYLEYMHSQIKELMTEYGKIDILWLDYSFDEYSGEKWKATELVNMIRKYQPDIIINSRLKVNEGNSEKGRKFDGFGDFETPEQGIPEQGVKDIYGMPVPWETCLTLNNSWGYSATDNEWKSPELVVHSLVDAVSKNGNLLLNVGPDHNGNIPVQSKEILKEVGKWMNKNAESIYGCKKAEIAKPEWGYFTQKGKTIYAHWTNPKVGYINIKGYSDIISKVYVLSNGKEAITATHWWGNKDKGNFFINIKKPVYHTFILPDKIDTVFKLLKK